MSSVKAPPWRAAACGALFGLAATAAAAETNYIYNQYQGGSPGSSWTGSVYWYLTNGAGATTGSATYPRAGNTYEMKSIATKLGNGTQATTLRPPYSTGTPTIDTFPGDSLILDTNVQIRFKELSTSGTSAQGLGYAAPTNNFPGANGYPGLVLNGGCLNTGDSYVFTIQGTMQAAPGTLSYLNPANSLSGDGTKRGLVIASQLSGSGGIALVDANSAIPQIISGTSNTFSGTWIIKGGWLVGSGDGTQDGYNSLGTNAACQFVVDPNWDPPAIFDSTAVFTAGPAILDMGSSALANCGGQLTLTNGGQLHLQGNVVFNAVTVEGSPIARGTYSWTYLNGQWPANFPAGTGTLTVQPYGPAPKLLPSITAQPLPEVLYPGGTARFNSAAAGLAPLAFHWQDNGANLANGGNISGATNLNLVITNVASANAGNYDMVASNPGGSVSSSVVPLTLLPLTEPYATAVVAANPVAFYEFNDPGDPATNCPAFDSFGGFVATYGAATGNEYFPTAGAIQGPNSSVGFPGFAAIHGAAGFANGTANALVTAPAFNLGPTATNVTITAWIYPTTQENNANGIVFCRAGTTVAGLCYSGYTDVNNNYTLGYNWGNDPFTYGWNSMLTPPLQQWSFVALVVTPTNATIYLMNTNGVASSSFSYGHVGQAFDGVTLIGDDSGDGGNGARAFNGNIADVAVFGSAFSQAQLLSLFTPASNVTNFPPYIATEPVSLNVYPGMPAQFNAPSGGSAPLYYQWQAGVSGSGVFTNLVDGNGLTGSTSATLAYAGVTATSTADLQLVVSNAYGAVTSSVVTLMVLSSSPAEAITLNGQEPIGDDWDTGTYWSDGNPASVSAYQYPGSTYEVPAGTRLRTPAVSTNAIFPGVVLTIEGDSNFTNNPAAGNTTMGEMRFKQVFSGDSVTISNLVLNGGQIDLGNGGLVVLNGQLTVETNSIIYIDSGGSSSRQLQLNSQLAGAGGLMWHAYDTTFNGELILACQSNTFTGTWLVDQGLLAGLGTNSLGTNNLTISTGGSLWTGYDITNSTAGLFLNGKLLLTQDDLFKYAAINGAGVPPGVYYPSNLAALYPANFPTNWTGVGGTTNLYTASGSLTILQFAPPVITNQPTSLTNYPNVPTSFTVGAAGGAPFTYQWRFQAGGVGPYVSLSDGGVISGSLTNTLSISAPSTANAGNYVVVVSNPSFSVTSQVATLVILPTGAPETITMSGQEPIGDDWDTGATAYWSDGNPASTSAYEYPGSTYAILPAALMRTPSTLVNSTFPGQVLYVNGDGVFENGGLATIGEIRFKQPAAGSAVTFSNLVMNGGELSFGNPGYVVVNGLITVVSNTPIYAPSGSDNTRYMQMNARLAGTGSIEYHAWDSSLLDPLVINGTNNTYSGTWNIVQGLLYGSSLNSLGTNSITISNNASLFTSYNLVSPNATLTLNGQMLLNQNDAFRSVVINGNTLTNGLYPYGLLATLYPTNFPATWTLATVAYNGSGSINVGNYTPPPPPIVTLNIERTGSQVQLTWSQGTLLQAPQATGPWATNTATSPYLLTPAAQQMFYRVRVQ